jgi:spore coat protein A, manganese oxidase
MNWSRRSFLRTVSAGAGVAGQLLRAQGTTTPLLRIESLERFVDPLPTPPRALPLRSSSKEAQFRIPIREFRARCHRDMAPTIFWGYDGCCPGPTFDVERGQAITVEWVNQLPPRHLFPIDHTLCGAESDKPAARTVTHLHGGRVRPEDDGYPERWIVPGESARCFYPNEQDATALFYHDHAMGITRLNAAAGLVGLYLIRNEHERSLGLPAGEFEVPLVLFDRSFLPDGRIFYPVAGDPESPWVSEYYGGGILVNGKLFPYLEVQPRLYRFRILNASNGGFYRVNFGSGATARDAAITYLLIGSDQGFYREPQPVDEAILGPGERGDILFDFGPVAGKRVYLRTGFGGIAEFRVGSGVVRETAGIPKMMRAIDPLPVASAAAVRRLTLGDQQDRLGRSHRMLLNASRWSMPVSEKPALNSVEVWEFINLTDDTHPIHLHLVRFQVIGRRKFDLNAYLLTRKVVYEGPESAPFAWEQGWKDTVRCNPMTVTRIIAKFEGFAGRYVWHCHMLEHEDNEMMWPYEVVG